MADGAIFGTVRKWGHAAHSNGSATTVLSWTVPATPDGYYMAQIAVLTTSATGATSARWTGHCVVRCDNGDVTVTSLSTGDAADGGSGYTLTVDIASGALRILVTAASGYRSTAKLEVFGHEQAISLA